MNTRTLKLIRVVSCLSAALLLCAASRPWAQDIPPLIQQLIKGGGDNPEVLEQIKKEILADESLGVTPEDLENISNEELLKAISEETGIMIPVPSSNNNRPKAKNPSSSEMRHPVFMDLENSAQGQSSGPPSSNISSTEKGEYSGDTHVDILDLKNMEILDVLKLISQKSGLNIVASQNVKGRVTVYLKDIDVMEALHTIVDAYGWAFAYDGDIVKVMSAQEYADRFGTRFGQQTHTKIERLLHARTSDVVPLLTQVKSPSGKVIADEKSNTLVLVDLPEKVEEMDRIIKRVDVPYETEVFNLVYARAEDLSAKVTEALTPGLGVVRFDVRSNKLIVQDSPAKIKEIAQMVDAFDMRDKEVLIESKIIQITLTDDHKFGIDWEGIVRKYHGLSLKSDFDILGASDKRGQLQIGTLADDDYSVLIEALDTIGTTDILSSPRITTLNNEEAKILVGSTEPYVTTTTTTPSSGPTTTAESVNFIEVGVKLFVTPTIHRDDFITMKIKPEVSTVTGSLPTSNNNTIPIVETSEAETTVMVKDGVTIVIGGLIKEEKIKSVRKVPILGDIPGLSYIFKNVSDEVDKTEIAIFLTPRIITGDQNMLDLSAR